MTAADNFLLSEVPIRAIVARLQDDLPAAIALTEDEATDVGAGEHGLLVPPFQVLDFAPTPSHLTAFPTLAVTEAGNSDLVDDIGSSVTGHHPIAVLCFLGSPDQRALAWGLRRYLQAVTRTVLAGRRLPPVDGLEAAFALGASSIRWGGVLEAIDHPDTWMAWAGVVIWTRREEILS